MAKRVIKYDPQATFNVIAGSAIAEGDLVGVNGSGTGNPADATATQGAAATNRAWGFAVKAAAIGQMVAVAPIATIDGLTGLTVGAPCYLGAAGAITQTKNVTAGQTQQLIGMARSATEVLGHITAPRVAQAAGTTTDAGF